MLTDPNAYSKDKKSTKEKHEGKDTILKQTWIPIVRNIHWLAMNNILEGSQAEPEITHRRKRWVKIGW